MRKNLFVTFVVAMSFFFSGCGGGDNNYVPPVDAIAIDINDIRSGYQFNGVIEQGEKAGEEVKLIYCPDGAYSYYRGNDEMFTGTYTINSDETEVVMHDSSDGGSYALLTPNHLFEEGQFYSCRGLDKYTTGFRLEKILEHSCPNHQ